MSEMLERTSFDTPVLPRLQTIISELQSGVYVIPEFQRPSVWKDEQRLDLLDSIVKGLPIGSLLVWRSSTHELGTYKEIAGISVKSARAGLDKRTYLIDGHQRITTLFGALVRPPVPRQGKDARRWPIYYELGTAESPAFRFPKPNREPEPHWLPLDMLTDGKALSKFRDNLYKLGEDEKADEVERVANVFKDYIIPVVPLVTESLDLVTDAFVRINSQGSEMTEAHMLRALTYLKPDHDTDRAFHHIRKELESHGWSGVPDQLLVNSLKIYFDINIYRSSVTAVKKRLEQQPHAFPRLQVAMIEAVELLRGFGVHGLAALPYAHHFITLTKLAAERSGSLASRAESLRSWFLRTTYAEHFTGQTSGQIRREIDLLLDASSDEDPAIALGAEIGNLRRLRKGTVRTKAFLLFLARRPADVAAATQRADILGQSGKPTDLFRDPGIQAGDPGNALVADLSELRELRKVLARPSFDATSEQALALADEFALPAEALACLPDKIAFVRKRREILLREESAQIAALGLQVRDDLANTSDDDHDHEEAS
jgi:Protein of unknown function DUF262